MPNISYSPQGKILSIRLKKTKSADSDVSKNVVVDYDANGNIVNIDVMGISMDEFQKAHVPMKELMTLSQQNA